MYERKTIEKNVVLSENHKNLTWNFDTKKLGLGCAFKAIQTPKYSIVI